MDIKTLRTHNKSKVYYEFGKLATFLKKTPLAFTLAETLIVIGIIGVIAALTIPSLNNQTSDKEKVAKVKKAYSVLNDAVGRAVAAHGPFENWCEEASKETICNRIIKHLKTTKVESYTNHSCTVSVTDGTEIKIFPYGDDRQCAVFEVDIDGSQNGKNAYSIDKFYFETDIQTSTVSIPSKMDATTLGPNYCSTNTKILADLAVCASAWIINNGNIDYLKCKDKLSETVTECD